LENPAGEGAPVGSSEEEHPETFVHFFAAKKQHSSVVILLGVVAVVVPAATRLVEHLDAHVPVVEVVEDEHEADFEAVVARELLPTKEIITFYYTN
jgi:NAD-dependent SIR2 family protein deacetylase